MIKDIDFVSRIYNNYGDFREPVINKRRFKHSDIKPLIEKLRDGSSFSVKTIGESVQNREIYLVSAGKGKTSVFLWSQMHGNESTATMALFDIFNFFREENQFEEYKKGILDRLTIHFIPMVNPDGAEVFARENSFLIDINRDAVRQQTPEGKILKNTFESIKPDFGFNLHDQSIYYSAGRTFKSAALSFLAPPAEHTRSVIPARKKAMQLIGYLNKIISGYIPGHTGRYTDEYEPRAFGDLFQAHGTSTVLIETGGWKNDTEKQFLRKLNFILLLSAFSSIAEGSYLNEDISSYENIPLNQEDNLFDLILRNLVYSTENRKINIDIGINRTEFNKDSAGSYYCVGRVADIGDLSVYSGYEDYDLNGMEISVGKIFNGPVSSLDELSKLDFPGLYAGGFTGVSIDFPVEKPYSDFPLNIVLKADETEEKIAPDGAANFCISGDNKIKFVVINGYFVEIKNPHLENVNGEVIR